MGDYGGSYNHGAAEEVNYGGNGNHEDWSWMHNTPDNAANVAEEGEDYEDGVEYSHSSQQVATTSGHGHRRVRSASEGLLEDDQVRSSQGGELPKTKRKGVSRQFEHLREPSLDTHSDPGYGDDVTPDYARSQSIDLVSSWLQDASLGEHGEHAHGPPARRPPPRFHPPGADMVARSASLPNHYETYPAGEQYNNVNTPPYDPAYEYQLGVYDLSVRSAPGGIYRLEEKRLDKALKFMKSGAVGFANVSKTAAVALKDKSIEFKNLAIPVVKPIFDAVIEESKDQLMGSDRSGLRGPAYAPRRPNSAELDRMATPYVPALGRGRAGRASMMRPGMAPGQRPVMRPGMPGAGPRPLVRPGLRPGMPPPQGAVSMAARGQGVVAMRGQPRPRGRARPVGPTDPY